jgi:hypothetical protein
MKKLALLAAVFGLVAAAHAQAPFGLPVTAIGYDDNLKHITARLPLGGNDLDVGVGFKFDNGAAEPFSMGLSGIYLIKTNTWGPVTNYLAAGGVFKIIDAPNDNVGLAVLGGMQPEVKLLEHIILSTRLGVQLDVLPEFVLATFGSPISVVAGVNFKILF